MKLKITLIRGGLTQGGKEGRLLGRQDEMLLDEGVNALKERTIQGLYPPAELIYTSPLLRCRAAAALIYPRVPAVVLNGLEDMDLGIYNGYSYGEILLDKPFVTWLKSDVPGTFPSGENPYKAVARSIQVFRNICDEMLRKGICAASIVTHRMAISWILQRYCIPRNIYKEWITVHGGGYVLEYDSLQSAAYIQRFL